MYAGEMEGSTVTTFRVGTDSNGTNPEAKCDGEQSILELEFETVLLTSFTSVLSYSYNVNMPTSLSSIQVFESIARNIFLSTISTY